MSHKRYISPLCPEVPRERIVTKFGGNVLLWDMINPDKLCVNPFKGFDFIGVKISIFPSQAAPVALHCYNGDVSFL